jgi:hypothetical protein
MSGMKALVGLIVAVGLVLVVAVEFERFLGADYLARYRARAQPDLGYRPAIVMTDVALRSYRRDRLMASAHIERVEVARNRQTLALTGTEGRYFACADRSFGFAAARGEWSANARVFVASGEARLFDKQIDLRAPQLQIDQDRAVVRVPGTVRGRFYRGDLVASGLTYDARSGDYRFGPASWSGVPDLGQDATARTRWTIKTDGVVVRRGDTEVWPKAEATDGEIIVTADRIERNVKTDVVIASGAVRYFGAEENLICDKVTIYRRERRAVLEGNVQLFLKPEGESKLEKVEIVPMRPIVPEEIARARPAAPSDEDGKRLDDELRQGENRRKYPTTILAQRIEYWYRRGERRAIVTGAPQARQELPGGRWRMIWSHRAQLERETERLRLESRDGQRDVRFQTSLGDDLRARWVELSTKEGDDEWSAEGVEGVVVSEEDEIPRERRQGPPPRR